MTRLLKSPGDLLAAIPALIGAQPHESLVIVGIGTSGELAPIARIDIEACQTADGARAVARECTGHLARSGAQSLMVIAYSERAFAPEAIAHVSDGLRGAFDVTDTWVVAQGRFRSPDCTDPACCPTLGRPLPPMPAMDAMSDGDVGRLRLRAHRQDPTAPRRIRKPAREAFRRAMTARNVSTPEWRQRMLAAWRQSHTLLKADDAPGAAMLGRLAAGLQDTAVRDAVVIDLVPGEHDVADGLCRLDESGVREALARMVGTEDPLHPPHADLTAAVQLAETIAWVCPEALGPAYAIIAIARWWSGDLDAAEAAVTRSLDAEPGYRLAELIAGALSVRMPPGWLRVA